MLRIAVYLLIAALLFPPCAVAYEYESHIDPQTFVNWQPIIQRVRGYGIFVVVVNPENGHKALLGIDARVMKIMYYAYYWDGILEEYVYDNTRNCYTSVYPRHYS